MVEAHGYLERTLVVISAVNDDEILSNNLLRSDVFLDSSIPFRSYRDFCCAGAAYNAGIDQTTAEIMIFAHQDVFLPGFWRDSLLRAICQIEQTDRNWAVIGAFGLDRDGGYVGHAWSSGLGRRIGKPLERPVETVCIDEFLVVVRRNSGMRFDPRLPGFHLFGTDLVLAARSAGLGTYVADIPAIHNSRPVRQLGRDYGRSYSYMQGKWRHALPVPTLIAPIARSPWPLLRARVRLAWSWKRRSKRATDPALDPRTLVTGLDQRASGGESVSLDAGSLNVVATGHRC